MTKPNAIVRYVFLLVVCVVTTNCLARALKGAHQPSEEYKKLRAEALAGAKVGLTPKLKNPGITSGGLDPALLRTLEQQRAYLASKPLFSALGTVERSGDPACNGSLIRSVNGSRQGTIFTPRAPDNVYRIEGCSFGSTRGRVQLEPLPIAPGQPLSPIVLQLDTSAKAWSDREIYAHLDPHISGIPDSPVTLVLYLENGRRLELQGCFFVAVRGEPQLLSIIPASWVRLDSTMVRSRSLEHLEYVSPSVKGRGVPSDAAGTSALVVRSDAEQFAAGRDTYDFSHLNPGWIVDSVQLQTYTLSCPADLTYAQSFGHWDVAWDRHSFTITWEGEVCRSYGGRSLNFNLTLSQYAARVWVIGPVGTQPMPR